MKSILIYIKVKLQNTKDKEETIKAKKTNKEIASKGITISLSAHFSTAMTELRSGRIMPSNNNCQPRNLTPAKPRFQEQGRNRCFGLIKTDSIYNQQTLTKLTCKRCT